MSPDACTLSYLAIVLRLWCKTFRGTNLRIVFQQLSLRDVFSIVCKRNEMETKKKQISALLYRMATTSPTSVISAPSAGWPPVELGKRLKNREDLKDHPRSGSLQQFWLRGNVSESKPKIKVTTIAKKKKISDSGKNLRCVESLCSPTACETNVVSAVIAFCKTWRDIPIESSLFLLKKPFTVDLVFKK